ncbi:cation diffusion facilitator family transporter [Phaeobacter sp. QD34_3]|uniref:cation diffusion facilitator family transporter n=1 Tax=unclassified Phaeobacter TaxID=2621772 RepID=UPI00237F00E0|nr:MULTISPECIES: cation diffusion facilitator family transporter [unclassified Phaeobacter]MDE4132909.1 cation diffusion facilitator family transporter [Phaeobacter sp. QD34_3]MDE4136689.1 cation diffusion facilitator family transporter [Phaeobacter sp. QD34_24]MDE4174125.1 cation diffusion facilitator family transporter [Phaeobacter sp. PT47_59]
MGNRLTAHQLALGSILVSLIVLGMKVIAWWLTGSIALFSDALESLVNVGGAVLAWFAVRYASRPPDADHPFGHHKAEYFSAVTEGIMIIIAAFLILEQSIYALMRPVSPAEWGMAGLWINAGAMVANLLWARVLIGRGGVLKSPALVAGGRHLMSDVWTSAGVLVGLGLALWSGWSWLDPALALLVALNILREGYAVVVASVNGLMDSAAPAAEREEIEEIIHRSAEGALQVHGLKTRRAGTALFVEFHMVVAGMMTVRAAHDICDRVEDAIRAELPEAKVNIHVEPEHKLEKTGISPR